MSSKAIHLALRAALQTLPKLPPLVAWENKAFKRVVGQPYVRESLVPATATHFGIDRVGYVKLTGLYLLQWNGLADAGLTIADAADAVLALFAPGTGFAIDDSTPTTPASGAVVKIRSDLAPYRGQITAGDPGWARCTITIPWFCTTNAAVSVAA